MFYTKMQPGAEQRGCSCPKLKGYRPEQTQLGLLQCQIEGRVWVGNWGWHSKEASKKHLSKQSATAQNIHNPLFQGYYSNVTPAAQREQLKGL